MHSSYFGSRHFARNAYNSSNAGLAVLIFHGPRLFAMVGAQDEALSKTQPPKVTLVMLGLTQFGLLLAVEKPMLRAFVRRTASTATVLVDSMIIVVSCGESFL